MPDTVIVPSFLALLQLFAPHFTQPTCRTFLTVACGWVLALGRHTVTTAVRAANATRWKHISSFHRFFSKSKWELDPMGFVLVRMIDALVPLAQPLVVAVDDTLGRHTGKKIAAASMHRDPLLSTAVRVAFSWGHVCMAVPATSPSSVGRARTRPSTPRPPLAGQARWDGHGCVARSCRRQRSRQAPPMRLGNRSR